MEVTAGTKEMTAVLVRVAQRAAATAVYLHHDGGEGPSSGRSGSFRRVAVMGGGPTMRRGEHGATNSGHPERLQARDERKLERFAAGLLRIIPALDRAMTPGDIVGDVWVKLLGA